MVTTDGHLRSPLNIYHRGDTRPMTVLQDAAVSRCRLQAAELLAEPSVVARCLTDCGAPGRARRANFKQIAAQLYFL